MKKTMFELLNDSHTSGGHLTYLENLYEQFLASPDSVADDWKNFACMGIYLFPDYICINLL